MQEEYLPIGYKIGGHYQIVEVLGDDGFEIVYVVKDIHRLETPFVLKELFLKEYSFRDAENGVYILEKSKESFERTKEGVKSEINLFKKRGERNSIQVYGYFEENNTVYTIMEFVKSAKLKNYLKITLKETPKEVEAELELEPKSKPEIDIDIDIEEEKPKSYLFLKMLIASIVVFVALGIYGYKMIEEDKNKPKDVKVATAVKKATIPHPKLTDRTQKEESKLEENKLDTPPNTQTTHSTRYIPLEDEGEKEEKIEIDSGVPSDEITELEEDDEPIKIETKKEEPIKKAPPKESIEVVYVPPKRASDISLGTRVNTHTNNQGPKFNRENIRQFLESFISSSADGGSVDRILSHYDKHVDRYFSLRNITHKEIYRDKMNYNRKWVHRDFKLLDFEILNSSKINGIEYCDLRKRIKWSVSTKSGQHASGVSKVFMVLKRTPNGFKVKTIYSF